MSSSSSSTPLLSRSHGIDLFTGSTFLWRSGAIIAAAGVIAGAFGAHGLKRRAGITAESIHAWETASNHAVFNGLALLLISLHPRFSSHKFAGPAIGTGGLIFSGSIMALVLNRDRFRFLGPITPLGGIVMIAGYISLAL